jgi:hypothetical protein
LKTIAIHRSSFVAAVLVLLELSGWSATLSAQICQPLPAIQIVNRMVQTEMAAKANRQHFMYRMEERSTRTKGRLWDELVVETSGGRIQRLISEDGKPLSGSQEKAEDTRIAYLANHPGELRRQTQVRRDDEVRMADLLRKLPKIFLFKTTGSNGGCTSIAFQPNPSFQEQNYQDRVLHAMSGILLIHTPDMHLCGLRAHLDHKVEFGFGLLGQVNDQSHFSLARQEVTPGQWKMTKIDVHVDGSILLMKSVSRNEEASHYNFKVLARDLTVPEAAAILRSKAF